MYNKPGEVNREQYTMLYLLHMKLKKAIPFVELGPGILICPSRSLVPKSVFNCLKKLLFLGRNNNGQFIGEVLFSKGQDDAPC